MTRWFALVLCWSTACVGMPNEAMPIRPGIEPAFPGNVDLDALDADLVASLEEGRFPSAAAAIVIGGEVVRTTAYGWADLETMREATVDTPYMLASTSKLYIGIAVQQLVDDGVLSLHDRADAFLDFEVANPHHPEEPVRLAHLVSHTAGVRDGADYNRSYGEGDSDVALADFLEDHLGHRRHWRHAEPGEEERYSNVGASLAALVAAEAAGTDFANLTETRIFAPLGMDDTAWFLADLDVDEVAVPYALRAGGLVARAHYGYPTFPDGQLRSSVDDQARLMAMFQRDGELDGARVLAPGGVARMLEPVVAKRPEQGTMVQAEEAFDRFLRGHDGEDRGVTTMFYWDPEDQIGAVLLLNGGIYTHRRRDAMIAAYTRLFEAAEELAEAR